MYRVYAAKELPVPVFSFVVRQANAILNAKGLVESCVECSVFCVNYSVYNRYR